MGDVTLTDWDDEYALPTVVVFPNGATWRYEYNDHCSLTKIIGPLGEITQYAYAENGDCIAILDAMGNQAHYHYDEQGQLIKHLDCSGHMTRFFYHPDGQIDTVTNAENINTSYEFSDAGRLQRITQPNERVQQYHYNTKGQRASVKHPDGNQTHWQLNARGQITEITQANGQRIKYEYDGLGRLLTLTNQSNKNYQFSYDAVGRLLEEVDLIGQRKTYQYNKAGNLIAHTAIPAADEYDSEAVRETYEHDALGRVVIHHTEAHQTHYHYHYQYDTVEIVRYTQAEQHRAQSKQTEAVPLDTLIFNFDQYGRLIEEINHAGSFKNQYDLLSNLTQTLLPDGASFDHFYYGTGHLLETQFNRGETRKIIAEYTRDKLHREISRSQGALQQHLKFDASGRITNKSVFKNDHHPAYFALLEKRFTYNTRDELIGKQINRGSPEKTLSWASQQHEYSHYDAVGQCISRLGDPQLGEVYYDYDEAGNHYDHYRWTVQSNQLQEYRGKQYKYDGFGRLRAIIHWGSIEKAFEYDCQNQMIASLNNSSSTIKAQYEYDALGRRIKKLVHKSPKRAYTHEGEENKTQFFFWQGLRMVGETTEAHLENRRWYAYNEGSYEPIAFIDYWDIVKRDEVYYYHTNINGAPEELTSGSGGFTWQGLFSLFGKRYREHNDGHTLYGQPLRFQGQYFDEETGLHYNTFRYYDPETGRFTQQDPIGLAGGINLYQYGANPLSWIDPLGLDCSSDAIELRNNMVTDDIEIPVYKNSAHHIVMSNSTDERMINLRAKMENF